MIVSIIIAVKTWQKNLEECVAKCLELDYPDFEIIILPDKAFARGLSPKGAVPIKVIPTGNLKPADKRDIGSKHAKGEIIAFIDDDAYPVKDWLKSAIVNFSDPEVAAVGGPAITPPDDTLSQQASGKIYSSLMVSGNFVYRYVPKVKRTVDDLPSCNFIVRKDVIEELGGFNTSFWPGEDTKLCLDIAHKLGKKIIYDPAVLVFHHRRTVFMAHLKQIANYALHRGYFVKKFPETSLKLSYFIPSIFVAGLIFGPVVGLLSYPAKLLYLVCAVLYLTIVFISSLSGTRDYPRRGLSLSFMVFSGIVLTHITYGIFFIKGLLARGLKE
ncbi:MAG: glycosyltransferase [Candidatus Omnitrophica bacterium]|nr:glycosyltransferase [Candidatus Omnitrophota bacterium]